MSPSSQIQDRAELTRASSISISSVTTVEYSLHAKEASTPPTSIGDSASISSASLKLDDALPTSSGDFSGRSRRSRKSVETYNVKILSGTAVHAPKKFTKDSPTRTVVARRRTISGNTLVDSAAAAGSPTEIARKDAGKFIREGIEALDLEWSAKITPLISRSDCKLSESSRNRAKQQNVDRRKSTRSTGEKPGVVSDLTRKIALGKRKVEDGLLKAKRELRNLADTKEFAKIDTAPVIHEVWSKGKLMVPEPPQKKKRKVELESNAQKSKLEERNPVEKKVPAGRRQKVWLNKGLYAGQEAAKFDWFASYTEQEKATMETARPYKENKYLPMPMWHGQRLLHVGRDFKLPFDVCSPLPPGQPKPDEWKKTSSSKLMFSYTLHIVNIASRSLYRQRCCEMEELEII